MVQTIRPLGWRVWMESISVSVKGNLGALYGYKCWSGEGGVSGGSCHVCNLQLGERPLLCAHVLHWNFVVSLFSGLCSPSTPRISLTHFHLLLKLILNSVLKCTYFSIIKELVIVCQCIVVKPYFREKTNLFFMIIVCY